jgi:Fic family protein
MFDLRQPQFQQGVNQTAAQAYDELIAILVARQTWDVADVIRQLISSKPVGIAEQLQQIDQLKVWLDNFRPLSVIVIAELKRVYDVRFIYNSNAIEGNTLTQSETELVLTTGITIGGKTLREHLEVIGHKDAIDYIETLAQHETRIGEWEIKQIHNLILRAIAPEEAGRYRTLDVKAAGTEYVYPPHYLLPDLMAEYVTWLNSDIAKTLHPVVYATEAHIRFVSIHPFRDGNGRTGRLLMNLLLLRADYPIVVIRNQLRQDYIDAIVERQQTNQNSNQLLTLVINATQEALIDMLRMLVTAEDSKGKGLPFYQELLKVLRETE